MEWERGVLKQPQHHETMRSPTALQQINELRCDAVYLVCMGYIRIGSSPFAYQTHCEKWPFSLGAACDRYYILQGSLQDPAAATASCLQRALGCIEP